MITPRSNGKTRKGFYTKDYAYENGNPFSVTPANASAFWTPTGISQVVNPDLTPVMGYKNFTLLISILQTDHITGIELGIFSRIRKEDTQLFNLPLKTNLNDADFKDNLCTYLGAYKTFTISFGGNSNVYSAYAWTSLIPYIISRNDSFTVQYLSLYAQS